MFLNITNHPSETWSSAQVAAAEKMGGEIVDLAFPDVPPDASSEEVLLLGKQLISGAVEKKPLAVLVQGEFTLAFLVVRELQSLGFPCYAATTRRHSESKRLEEGATRVVSQFEFVQFRRYL